MSEKKVTGSIEHPDTTQHSSGQSTDIITRILRLLGNYSPSSKQRQLIKTLLSNITLNTELIVDSRLTRREKESLTLAALGYTVTESAELLDLERNTVEGYHKGIKQKLHCKTIAKAVITGMRCGLMTELKKI